MHGSCKLFLQAYYMPHCPRVLAAVFGVMGSVALWFSHLFFYADEAPIGRFHSEQEQAVPSIRNHACIGSALIIFMKASAVVFVEKSFDHLFSSTR